MEKKAKIMQHFVKIVFLCLLFICKNAQFQTLQDDVTVIYTDGNGAFVTRAWSGSSDGSTVSIRACSDAKIALSVVPMDIQASYIITLGADGNTKTIIEKNGDSGTRVEFASSQLLSCSDSRDFWWSIKDSTLSVGTGSRIDQDEIGHLEDAGINVGLSAIHITTDNGQHGRWTMSRYSAHDYTIITAPSVYSFNQFWTTIYNSDHFIFYVKSCSDALVLLSQQLESQTNRYKVAIGTDGNSMTRIMDPGYGGASVLEDTPGILSCDESRPFWVRWGEGVEVGRGTVVGAQPIVRLQESPGKPIEAASLSSGWSSPGEWRISNVETNTFRVRTPGSLTVDYATVYEDDQSFEFWVRSCDGVTLTLRTDSGPAPLGIPVGPTDCHAMRKFWIYWNGTEIFVGRGNLLENEFMSRDFGVALSYYTVSMRSASVADWEFRQDAGKSIKIMTSPDYSDRYYTWLEVTGQRSISFRAKGCYSAKISLSQYRNVIADKAYEITLSGDKDVQNSITDENGVVKALDSSVVLDCQTYKWFWVSWSDQDIYVGEGWDIGGNSLIHWSNADGNHPINHLAFNGINTDVFWEFTHISDSMYEVETSGAKSDHNVWFYLSRQYFAFSYQSCGSAWITLAEIPGAKEYEIQISNQKSSILEVETNQRVEADTPDILSCHDYRDLWVAWDMVDGKETVTVGTHAIFVNATLELTASGTSKPIHHLRVSSDEQGDGYWRFAEDSAVMTKFFTSATTDYQKVVYRAFTKTNFVFNVLACSNAQIILLENYHLDYELDYAYEVVIGAEKNQFTQIRKPLLAPLVQVATPNILGCTRFYREFWVSWGNGRIAVGHGSTPGVREIAAYTDSDPISVSYLALSTGGVTAGQWEISAIPDDAFVMKTNKTTSMEKMWTTFDTNHRYFEFGIKSCNDAEIYIRRGGQNSSILYKLVLGGQDNTKIQIFMDTGMFVTDFTWPGLLNCYEYRHFVIKLENFYFDILEAGRSGRLLVSVFLPGISDMHGISLATSNSLGEWIIPRVTGQPLRYETVAADQKYCCLWHSVLGHSYTVLNVKACSQVSLLLSEILGVRTGDTYEINILEEGSNIKLGMDGNTVAEGNSSAPLQCDRFNTYWIKWSQDGEVSVGSGPIPGQAIFLYYKNTINFPITGISYASADSALWDFSIFSGNYYQFHTKNLGTYRPVVVSTRDRFFTFSVKACSDARLSLAEESGEYDTNAYQIGLGEQGNTRSVIRVGSQGSVLVSAETPGMVSCDEKRHFWVSWHGGAGGYIRVGRGNIINEDIFLTYADNTMTPIHILAMSTSNGATGEWEVRADQERLVRIAMPETDNYVPEYQWVSVIGYSTMVFRVRACENVHLVLSELLSNVEIATSEIVIGQDNIDSNFFLERDTEISATNRTPNILSCEEYRSFYVRWSLLAVHVGYGADGTGDIFLTYTGDQLHYITAIGMMNSEKNSVEYEIVKLIGNTYSLTTPAALDYNTVSRIYTPYDHFIFRVRACSDAHVALHISRDMYYEVVIGGYSNSKSEIRKQPDTEVVATADTMSFLSCDEDRYFWITWDDTGLLEVGSGAHTGALEFLAWKDPDFKPPTYLALSSGENNIGEWEMELKYMSDLWVETPEEFSLVTASFTLLDRSDIKFRVQACQGAHIVLSSVPKLTETLSYEIILGAQANDYLRINYGSGGDAVLEQASPNLLRCNSYRDFWISWESQSIKVGSGKTVGKNQIGLLENVNISFTSVSVGTEDGTVGLWQFNFPAPDYSPLSGGLSDGEAVGVAFGVIIGLLLLAAAGFFAYRYKDDILDVLTPRGGDPGHVRFENPGYGNAHASASTPPKDTAEPTPNFHDPVAMPTSESNDDNGFV